MEEFKDIPDYEGKYQISNLGNVKSLSRKSSRRITKEMIMGKNIGTHGYFYVFLFKDNIKKPFTIHQLVAITFLNHIPCKYKKIVNHINGDKLDNRVENLEIVSARENITTCYNSQKIKHTSQYPGVSWDKGRKKWVALIFYNKKQERLGAFKTELEAHEVYQNKLKMIQHL